MSDKGSPIHHRAGYRIGVNASMVGQGTYDTKDDRIFRVGQGQDRVFKIGQDRVEQVG